MNAAGLSKANDAPEIVRMNDPVRALISVIDPEAPWPAFKTRIVLPVEVIATGLTK